jgi:lipoate-protein ligase A
MSAAGGAGNGADHGADGQVGPDAAERANRSNGAGPLGGHGRLILSEPADGPTNMAIDAAILECLEQGSGGAPTLRFYGWEAPTLSLGYFQTTRSREGHPDSRHAPLVRRASGGGAIVHDRELTYSLTIPDSLALAQGLGDSRALYRRVHDVFRSVFRRWGIRLQRFADSEVASPAGEPFLCFQRRTDEDLVLQGYKVLGSAQRRGRAGVLQHGSLLVSVSAAAPQLPGIVDLFGRCPTIPEVRDCLIEELGEGLGVQWQAGQLSAAERVALRQIRDAKFGSAEWTEKR